MASPERQARKWDGTFHPLTSTFTLNRSIMRTHVLLVPALLLTGPIGGADDRRGRELRQLCTGRCCWPRPQAHRGPHGAWRRAAPRRYAHQLEQAYSGSNSAKWNSTALTGGPSDMVVDLGITAPRAMWAITSPDVHPNRQGRLLQHPAQFRRSAPLLAVGRLVPFPRRRHLQRLDERGHSNT